MAGAENKRVKTRIDASAVEHPIDPEVQLRVQAEVATSRYEIDTNAQLRREEMASKERIADKSLAAAKANKPKEPKKEKVSG
jgi:hypothetical protein